MTTSGYFPHAKILANSAGWTRTKTPDARIVSAIAAAAAAPPAAINVPPEGVVCYHAIARHERHNRPMSVLIVASAAYAVLLARWEWALVCSIVLVVRPPAWTFIWLVAFCFTDNRCVFFPYISSTQCK